MSNKTLEKRRALGVLSRAVKKLAENTDLEDRPVNELLMTYAYNPTGNLTFRSFNDWKESGFIVKKGSRALMLWGQPVKDRFVDEETGEITEEEPEEGAKFFPLAYVFSDLQVMKRS